MARHNYLISTAVDMACPHPTFHLGTLLAAPEKLPFYDHDVPDHWFTNRSATWYIGNAFADDKKIQGCLGIFPGFHKQIYRGARTEEIVDEVCKGVTTVPRRTEKDKVRYGGIEEFFSPGKVILELGSGEGYALLQFHHACRHREENTWFGVDYNYHHHEEVEGVHFLPGDFHDLETIPDESIDSILSVQAAFLHGDIAHVVQEVTRIARPGAIIRSVPSEDFIPHIFNHLSAGGWECYSIGEHGFSAKKLS